MSSHAEWDGLRSQILTRLSRCEVRAARDPAPPSKPMFFVSGQGEPYYGPTNEARAEVNFMLGLHAAAGQMEWRAEMKRPGRIEEALAAIGDPALDVETRSVFALLLLDAVDRMAAYGTVPMELLGKIRWQLRRDAQVRSRMRYFWTHMEGSRAVLGTLC